MNKISHKFPNHILGDPSIKLKPIDLSIENEKFMQFPNHTLEGMASYFQTLDQSKVYAGGYNEMRPMYQSPLFISIEEERNLHIGYDIWLEAGTKIYAPLNSEVHSFAYNDNGLDYGATIILKSIDDSFPFYLLFGHLSMDSIAGLQEGQKFDGGQELARIGNETENGGWFPHLHLQLIRDIGDWKGDYPGVIKASNAKYYLNNCPNPELFI